MTIPPLSDFLPAIMAVLVGVGVFIAAHVAAWRAHARADREAASKAREVERSRSLS